MVAQNLISQFAHTKQIPYIFGIRFDSKVADTLAKILFIFIQFIAQNEIFSLGKASNFVRFGFNLENFNSGITLCKKINYYLI